MDKNVIINTNMISLGVSITNNMIDHIDQAKLNVLAKDIIKLHRDRKINASFDVLASEFTEVLKAGPTQFIKALQEELSHIDNVNNFLDLRNHCPIIAYVLTGDIKVLGKFSLLQPTGGRIYAAYVAAVQSLDDII